MNVVTTLLFSAVGLASTVALAQPATVGSIPATSRVYVPIAVSLTNAGLSFGDVFASAAGGTLVLDPATDLRTVTGGLTLGTLSPVNSAIIKVAGKRSATFAITLPANGTVTLTGPGAAMALNAFTVAVGSTALKAPFTSKLPEQASAFILLKVGGTLVVGANQADGDYAGTFSVLVAYN
jgi:hypothetical protein